jgi:topoisomerase-4 subunit A
LIGSSARQWKRVASDLTAVKKALGADTVLGARRTTFEEAPSVDVAAAVEARIPREPISVIVSERGWIRAAKGRIEDPSTLTFKEGDKLAFLVPAETTDKLLLFASDGRFFTLACDKLPSARGQGEPLRLMIELDEKEKILAVFAHKAGRMRVLASKSGYGFLTSEDDALAMRRAGKQVLNVGEEGAVLCLEVAGDHLAVIGDNGKILIFPLNELPTMPRGKGVKLQSYREGGLRDGLVFTGEEGAYWIDSSGRRRAWSDWRGWIARRAASGRLAPRGFASNRRFGPS